jgi:hypothetical protein
MLWHQGQPLSRERAAAELAAFDADEVRVKAALSGDIAAQQERRDLWMLARGMQPGSVPVTPSDATSVQQQMDEREQQVQEARLATWEKHIRMTDNMRAEARRGLATQQNHDDAVREVRRMLDDKDFGAKILAGNSDAKDKWARCNFVASLPIAPADYDWSEGKAND